MKQLSPELLIDLDLIRENTLKLKNLTTNHSKLPYNKILDQSKILIDTRGQYKGNKSKKIHFI